MAQSTHKNVLREHRLERRILHGMASEWKSATWLLDDEHREQMRPPLFGIKEMTSRWGTWNPENREITINRKLAFYHSWDAVREILLHEMAHQLADEVLHASHEPPHGTTFRRACHMLRANPKASGSITPLDERILTESSEKEDPWVTRVRKLLALGKSKNRHEAESAMAKARELMTKYNLNCAVEHPKNNFVSIFLGKPRLRNRREEYSLANLLQDFYYIYGIWISAYVVEKEKMGRVLEISGTVANVQTASYVFDFVHRFIDAQWMQYNETGVFTHHRKTDFAIGIIEGFRSSLESKRKDNGNDKETALIQRGDKMLTAYASHRYPRVVTFNRSASRHHAKVYDDGMAIGKRLTIAKGIGKKSPPKKIPHITGV